MIGCPLNLKKSSSQYNIPELYSISILKATCKSLMRFLMFCSGKDINSSLPVPIFKATVSRFWRQLPFQAPDAKSSSFGKPYYWMGELEYDSKSFFPKK